MRQLIVFICFLLNASWALAGEQMYEPLSASVQTALTRSISDRAAPYLAFPTQEEAQKWLDAMSTRLQSRISDPIFRRDFLKTVHYEASRAGLDPQLVLGLIQVENRFKKYALSRAGARGYMQVMPFWVKLIGSQDHDLFHLRTNLRYGCTILRHYLDIENGNYFRALGRYNGSLGQSEYPNMVVRAWLKTWKYQTKTVSISDKKAREATG